MDTEDDPVRAVRLWDATYRGRVAKWPLFLATEPRFLELVDPPQVSESQMRNVFGSIPATLNPPKISCEELSKLVHLATNRAA
jgi:hypothetical protein